MYGDHALLPERDPAQGSRPEPRRHRVARLPALLAGHQAPPPPPQPLGRGVDRNPSSGGWSMRVLLGVTGGIAAYKAADLTSQLVKRGDEVRVIMTANATRFVGPVTFEALSGNPVLLDTFATG